MFLVVTSRPGVHPSWASRPHVTVQVLSGLSRATTATLIRQVAGGRQLPREVIDKITASADNVPLFIEELTKSVLETIQAAGEDGAPSKPPSVDAVPRSLHSSLMARLDRLSAGKEIAQMGAVIGREFSFEILQALSPQSSKQLINALAELAQAEIIITHGQPPFASYTFRHALVQDAAYASLLRDRRRAIHLRVAEEMVKDTSGETAEPQLIARHFAEAGDPDRAIEYYAKAAERATGRFALAEMVNYLHNGLRQIALLPESTQRHRRELTLQLTLGRTLIDHEGSNSEAVRTTFERARELCLALDELELLPKVYDGLVVNHYFIHSEPEKMFHYIEEMIGLHRRTGDPRALLTTWRAAFLANFLLGRFALARQDMEKLIEMYGAECDGPQSGMTTRDPKVSTCTFLGICLTILGQLDAGAAMSLKGVRHAKTLHHPVSLNLGLRRACVQGMLAGDAQRVIELSGELAALRAEFETYKGSWEGTFFKDWAQLWTQPNAERFDRVQAFLRQLDRTRNWGLLPFYMASAAELSGRHGDLDTAAALLERADELINTTGARWCEAEVLRLRARFSARNKEEAITLLRASVAKAREQEAELWESRAAADLAEVLSHQGTVSRSLRS
jgi:tetratricopeptide (TPR) repeat protein